jgi:hypothetical protein
MEKSACNLAQLGKLWFVLLSIDGLSFLGGTLKELLCQGVHTREFHAAGGDIVLNLFDHDTKRCSHVQAELVLYNRY